VPASLETISQSLAKLIKKFEADKGHYLSKAYPEAQARIDFISPFFKALGWDVENEAGLPHHQREVVVEKGEAETEGRPDYNFRIGGQTKFFVEAKAPSEPLDSTRHILQAKGYAWNTKQVFFVILTDFEEFRFYDASIKPDERKPDEGLLVTLKYTEYLEKADKLWEFSKERVAAGSLDAMLPRDRRTQRLRIPVDEAFLDEMTGWREDLARNVFKNSPGLTAKQLNEVVQRLLDRIVFIRIAEDRRIIEKMQLWDAVQHWKSRGEKFHIFDWLNDLFHKINEDFNGEIFKPHLSETIRIDSEVLAKIIERLYPPKSPYRFDVIGVELLGSIYERYLGKTIRPTAKTVRVEEKPEVRKAGGVYYTPKYIVDYIVKNTVGKVIEGKSPKQIEKIRILDPACGSGSFLIGAFQYLIDYHVRYLTAHPKEAHVHPLFPDLIPDGNGGHRLSVRLKAKILRHNLYGVDIDPQAVEITMMSLYLKALEGEKSQLPPKQSLLPELKYNIICGNSLIGPDIYDQGTLFADDERERINAFDWYADYGVRELAPALEGGGKPPHSKPAVSTAPPSFADIMRAGGFDCVIANPPYVRMEEFKNIKAYLKSHYKSHDERSDLYVYFIEKAHEVLRKRGRFGMIVSNKFFRANYGKPLRTFLNSAARIQRVVDLAGLPVFPGATVRTVVLVTTRDTANKLGCLYSPPVLAETFTRVESGALSLDEATSGLSYSVSKEALSESVWSFAKPEVHALLKRLQDQNTPLVQYSDGKICMGVKSGLSEAFVINAEQRLAIISRNSRAQEIIKPFLNGRDIGRFYIDQKPQFLIYTHHGVNIERYPGVLRHLKPFRAQLEERATQQNWYELQQPQLNFAKYMDGPKIIFADIATAPRFALDDAGHYGSNTTYFIPLRDLYLLGLLNSSLGRFYFSTICAGLESSGETYLRFFGQYLEGFPVRPINLSDPADKARHDRMVALVERMLELNKQKHFVAAALRPPDRGVRLKAGATDLEREIASTDAAIDNLVYELYGITAEDRKIIEGS
jgi:type I restriction-modification system DNA methylase subunit